MENESEVFLLYNQCFAKTPSTLFMHEYMDKLPVEGTHISSYREDLSRFATAVSNASFVEKNGIEDYLKLFNHNKLVQQFKS